MGLLRSVAVFLLLATLKYLSRIFYRHDMTFVGPHPKDPWGDLRLVAFLNHTSLIEPVFLGGVPNRFPSYFGVGTERLPFDEGDSLVSELNQVTQS